MILDDATAGNASGDLCVNEIACLNQKVACNKEVHGGC